MQGGTHSSEFRIPNSELEGSVELRVPTPQPSRLTPVPSDKILLPRRMLYVEAVLYVTVAVAAFGLGYLAGRSGSSAAGKEDDSVQKRVPVEGKVLLGRPPDAKQGDEGAVVIVLPAGRLPEKPLPIAGLRPSDPPSAAGDAWDALARLGGAAARADASGAFTLFAPQAGSYWLLVISRHATRGPDDAEESRNIESIGKYFDQPADLLQRYRYRWQTQDLRLGSKPIEVQFSE